MLAYVKTLSVKKTTIFSGCLAFNKVLGISYGAAEEFKARRVSPILNDV